MVKNLLILLLVFIISFQSFGAVIDLHMPHQKGVEHLKYYDNQTELTNESKDSQESCDCHHCCHCHGCHLTSLLPSRIKFVSLYGNQFLPNLDQKIGSYYHSRLLRPPKT